jgi:hypothetical protein
MLQTHIQNKEYLIFTVTMVTRMRLNVTFIPTLPVLSLIPLVCTHYIFLSTGFSPKILNSYPLYSVSVLHEKPNQQSSFGRQNNFY